MPVCSSISKQISISFLFYNQRFVDSASFYNINPFSTNVPLLYPLKTFSGGIEVEHWLKMDYSYEVTSLLASHII